MERPLATRGGSEKERLPRSREATAALQLWAPPRGPFDSLGGSKHEAVESTGLIPVAEGELAVIETYLGQALDELLGTA
jgi:hypothetical protein